MGLDDEDEDIPIIETLLDKDPFARAIVVAAIVEGFSVRFVGTPVSKLINAGAPIANSIFSSSEKETEGSVLDVGSEVETIVVEGNIMVEKIGGSELLLIFEGLVNIRVVIDCFLEAVFSTEGSILLVELIIAEATIIEVSAVGTLVDEGKNLSTLDIATVDTVAPDCVLGLMLECEPPFFNKSQREDNFRPLVCDSTAMVCAVLSVVCLFPVLVISDHQER